MFDPKDAKAYLQAIIDYQNVRPDYQTLCDYLQNRLRELALELDIYPIVMGRAKSLESFAEKIQRRGKQFEKDPVAESTDFCGVRIITHTLDEVETMAEAVKKKFILDVLSSEDKEEKLAYREFGYLSKHFIIQLPPADSEGVDAEYERLRSLKAELQLRTMAQHLWADIYHELGYKNEFQLPRRWEREFARLAALLENCDKGLQQIKDGMGGYESSYGAFMTEEELRELVTRLEILLEVDKGNVGAVHRLIRAYLSLEGSNEKIKEILERYGAVLKSYPPALRDVGVAYARASGRDAEQFAEGQALIREAVERNPRDIDALCSLGGTYRKQKQLERAVECYRKAHHMDPTNPYPLGNYIALEIMRKLDVDIIPYFHAAIRGAVERCKTQVEVGVNLPWALFDLGIFHLYLADPYSSISFYAKGIVNATQYWMIRSAHSTIRDFIKSEIKLAGLEMLDILLKVGWWIKAPQTDRNEFGWHPGKGQAKTTRFDRPVVILAGGCGGMEALYRSQLDRLREILTKGLKTGGPTTIVSGGTKSGIAEMAGDLQEIVGQRQLQTVGYLPRETPAGLKGLIDDRYTRHRGTMGSDFSFLEPLSFWEDFLASDGDPKRVKLIGFNGGRISACEFRIALALGAKVGIIEGSGRAADELLSDPLWKEHRADPEKKPATGGGSLHSLCLAENDILGFLRA